MPVNNWKHALFITDIREAIHRGEDFEPLLSQLVHRIRSAPFYDHDDIALRTLVDELATADSLEQAGSDFARLGLWGDQEQRLHIESTISLEEFNEYQRRVFRDEFVPPSEVVTQVVRMVYLPDAVKHPVLTEALAEWCEVTGTDPADLYTDRDFAEVSAALTVKGLLDFYDRRGEITALPYQQAAQRAALALLGGAYLAGLRGTPIPQATLRVIEVITEQLGTPTGYEGQADRLAREIHDGAAWEAM